MKKANLLGVAGGFALFCIALGSEARAAVRDVPFLQDSSEKFVFGPELTGASPRKLALDREGNIFVLTDRGMAKLVEDSRIVSLYHGYRSLEKVLPKDVVGYQGRLYYLADDRFFSNEFAGEYSELLPSKEFQRTAVASGESVLLTGAKNALLLEAGVTTRIPLPTNTMVLKVYAAQNQFYLLADNGVYHLRNGRFFRLSPVKDATVLGFRGREIVVGTRHGYYMMSSTTGLPLTQPDLRLPSLEITCLEVATNGIWFGTRHGVFLAEADGGIRYYASQRWLREDYALDIRTDNRGSVYVLGPASLSRLRFRPMTLEAKAAIYEENIRHRHIRYGFCAEVRLSRPGDVSTAQMIDTDNDGTWSTYYMASQAFHYASTGDERARQNAWETFTTMERLLSITGVPGLPARSFERTGFKVSDPEKWRPAADAAWEWKFDTSSDEIVAHWFGASVMLECVAKTPAERQRVARFIDAITSNIVRHNFQLLDWNGQPTRWGRWNPEYVNSFPLSVFDRRLNSTEIFAGLQTAYQATGEALYSQAFQSLVLVLGPDYLDNVLSPMSRITRTQGADNGSDHLGDSWNHSDDLLAFISYWMLVRSSPPDLKSGYIAAVRDHFRFEKNERCPLFNFIYASTGAADAEIENAVWTLRRYPLDLVTWKIINSQRSDVTLLPPNFRQQELVELLPPGERPVTRWNTHPFVLDGGDGGITELAGDEFLLPYWMGRYLRLIE